MLQVGQQASCTRSFWQRDFDTYAELSGDDNPVHLDAEFAASTRFGSTVAHGMLVYSVIGRCLGALLPGPGTAPSFQELMFTKPTFTSEEITTELEIEQVPMPGMARIKTTVTKGEGIEVCLGAAQVWLPGEAEFRPIPFPPPQDQSREHAHRGLAIGQGASVRREFSMRQLEEYNQLAEETNPIHTDRAHARALGFENALLPGALVGGMISSVLGTQLPGRGTLWLKQSFHFLKPVYPERELTAEVEIIRIRPEKDFVNLRTRIKDRSSEVLVDGEALVLVSDLAA